LLGTISATHPTMIGGRCPSPTTPPAVGGGGGESSGGGGQGPAVEAGGSGKPRTTGCPAITISAKVQLGDKPHCGKS